MRIQVVFKSTPILVPCGDGKLTVGELIEKAIVRFKKLGGNRVREITETVEVGRPVTYVMGLSISREARAALAGARAS